MREYDYEWGSFGLLVQWFIDNDGYLCIKNDKGEVKRMSSKFSQFEGVKDKLPSLLNCFVQVATSKTTQDWETSKWFCAIAS